MNKELRKTLKHLQHDGFTVVQGSSHLKILTPDGRLLQVVPNGKNHHDRVPGGADKEIRKALKRWEEGLA